MIDIHKEHQNEGNDENSLGRIHDKAEKAFQELTDVFPNDGVSVWPTLQDWKSIEEILQR